MAKKKKKKYKYSHGGPHNTDLDKVKKGLRYVESSDGLKMINPYSSATGLYGQLYNAEELQNMSYLQDVDRQSFASDTTLQNRLFEDRYYGRIPGVPGLGRNANDLRVEYKKVLEDKGIPFNYTDDEISALSNLLGRQGTREYFGYVLRDGRSLADVFPKIYGPDAEAPNKTPEKYLETYRIGRDLKYGGDMKKIKKYNNGGDPPVKQPDYLQYKGPNYFNAGSPAYDMETYQKAITRDSTALADAFFPSWMFEEAKRLQLNRQLLNELKPYTDAEIKDLNLVGEQYTGPAVDMDMFMQQYMESGIDDQAYGGEVSEYKGGGLWANIHAKRARGEKMRKKGEKGAPTEAQMARARAAYGGKSMDVDYEAEGGEVVIGDISVNRMYNGGTAKQYKGANMFMLGGPSHADGGIGIKVNSDEPSYVFTDRLKVGGMKGATYADMAAKFGNELNDINTMAMGGDKYDRTTAKLMNPRIMEDVKDLFDDQEAFKKENNIDQEPRQAAMGAALMALQYLPAAINIGKALFGKTPEMNLGRIQPEFMEEQSYTDFNPLMNTYLSGQSRNLETLRKSLEGSGATGSQLRSNLQAGVNQSQIQSGQFFGNLAQQIAMDKRATDATNLNIGNLNYQRKMDAENINTQRGLQEAQFAMQNDPMQSFSQGVSQGIGTATSQYQQGVQEDLLMRMFPAAYGGKYGIK